jgi:hypothetical protein
VVTWQLTYDANDPDRLARFWAPLLGYEPAPPPAPHPTWKAAYLASGVPEHELADLGEDYCDRIHDPAGGGPPIWFQVVPETKSGKNRLHLDVYPTGRDRTLTVDQRRDIVDARVAELVGVGATVVRRSEEANDYHVVMHDPEGNEFCVG